MLVEFAGTEAYEGLSADFGTKEEEDESVNSLDLDSGRVGSGNSTSSSAWDECAAWSSSARFAEGATGRKACIGTALGKV